MWMYVCVPSVHDSVNQSLTDSCSSKEESICHVQLTLRFDAAANHGVTLEPKATRGHHRRYPRPVRQGSIRLYEMPFILDLPSPSSYKWQRCYSSLTLSPSLAPFNSLADVSIGFLADYTSRSGAYIEAVYNTIHSHMASLYYMQVYIYRKSSNYPKDDL
jgi:hypothetical protein